MEHYKISKLLNFSTLSNFVTKRMDWNKDLLCSQLSAYKNISFKTPIRRSDLCDYSDMHFVLKGSIDLLADNGNEEEKYVTFKNNSPFRLCISKIIKHIHRQCRKSWHIYTDVKSVRM